MFTVISRNGDKLSFTAYLFVQKYVAKSDLQQCASLILSYLGSILLSFSMNCSVHSIIIDGISSAPYGFPSHFLFRHYTKNEVFNEGFLQ